MKLFFVLITLIDLSAAAIIFVGALSERMRLYPLWHKIGLIVSVVGLVAQSFRNMQFLLTGYAPSDSTMPLWAMKDLGVALIAYAYLYLGIKKHLDDKKAPVKRVEPKLRNKRQVK